MSQFFLSPIRSFILSHWFSPLYIVYVYAPDGLVGEITKKTYFWTSFFPYIDSKWLLTATLFGILSSGTRFIKNWPRWWWCVCVCVQKFKSIYKPWIYIGFAIKCSWWYRHHLHGHNADDKKQFFSSNDNFFSLQVCVWRIYELN